jgi:aspartyl-tRNA(Asn)/glutamyl-tRNA(Gln) amidotransferase subunit A
MSTLTRAQKLHKQFNIFTSLAKEVKTSKLIAIKDNIATVDLPTTCSSKLLSNYVSPFPATAIELLKDYEVIGKTNMDEFGMGAGTTHSHYGVTLNPMYPDERRICGGSSGGSAAAVASGIVSVALGTDTGGSVRQPASYTGILGFKPTYGRISRWGVVSYAQSLDTVGILGNSVNILRDVYHKLDKYDVKDPTCLKPELREQFKFQHFKKLRIGVPQEYILGFSPLVSSAWEEALTKLSETHEIVPVSIPLIKLSLPVYFTLAPAEASSNLARYDGIRYGVRADDDKNFYASTRSQGFGDEVKQRIMLGNYNLNADSYKNHFLRAKQIRQALKQQFNAAFRQPNHLMKSQENPGGVDFLLTPTTVSTAPTIDEFKAQSSTENYVQDVLTIPASLAGLPAISFPWKLQGTRVGLQLMGQYGDDAGVLDTTEMIMSLNE